MMMSIVVVMVMIVVVDIMQGDGGSGDRRGIRCWIRTGIGEGRKGKGNKILGGGKVDFGKDVGALANS